jgi:hypothetical protein
MRAGGANTEGHMHSAFVLVALHGRVRTVQTRRFERILIMNLSHG